MIAVLGATGTIGKQLAPMLGEPNLPARAVVRPSRVGEVPLPTTPGDLLDRDSLELAFDGASDLFLLTPHGPQQDEMERNALEAALAAGVQGSAARIVELVPRGDDDRAILVIGRL